MRLTRRTLVTAVIAIAALVVPATAEVVYTQVNVSIPVGGYYAIDLNHDGVADFSLRSPILQGLCQSGDQDSWNLTINPGTHTFTLDGVQNYSPVSQKLEVKGTSVVTPMLITFTQP